MAEPNDAERYPGIGVLNRRPLIIHLIFGIGPPFSLIEALSLAVGRTPMLVLLTNFWSMLSRWKTLNLSWAVFLQDYQIHKQRYPHHPVVLLANDELEQRFLAAFGVEAVVFQHNGLLHAYEMPRPRAKEFDAILNARIERHKRIELAKKIESCCVVFGSANREYYQEIEADISHFSFVNGNPADSLSENAFFSQTPLLSRAEIAEWCARSRVGVSLSEVEGANFASGEYMLWGLPVVSTRSLGGRDHYFDARFWLICEDNPDAVAAAVKEAIARQIDPHLIRNTFLANVMARRAGLLESIVSRTAGWGGSLDSFVRDWLGIDTPFLDRVQPCSARMLLAELEQHQED